jgi:hypothetical protein
MPSTKRLNLPPVESALDRWKREGEVFEAAVQCEQRERRRRERASVAGLTAADIDARIAAQIEMALKTERALILEVIADAIGESLDREATERKRELRDEVRSLRIELAELATITAELRAAIASEHGQIVPLPRRAAATD